MNKLTDAIEDMNNLPDVDACDSSLLHEFCERTAREIKACGGISAATSLEMIGYIRKLEEENRRLSLESVMAVGKLRLLQSAAPVRTYAWGEVVDD